MEDRLKGERYRLNQAMCHAKCMQFFIMFVLAEESTCVFDLFWVTTSTKLENLFTCFNFICFKPYCVLAIVMINLRNGCQMVVLQALTWVFILC